LLNLGPVFWAIFYSPKPEFSQPTNLNILKNLELLFHSNINDTSNTEVAEWHM